MTFSYSVMFIGNMFIFKRKAYRCLFFNMAAVYQLKIKYDQDKFTLFLDAKRPVSFPLEGKHVVNEHRVEQKSQRKIALAWGIPMYHVIDLKLAASKTLLWKAAKNS